MSKVAIIGSGFIGRAWAITFARAGHHVTLWDADPAAPHKAIGFIAEVLPELAENGLLDKLGPDAMLANITPQADLAAALAWRRLRAGERARKARREDCAVREARRVGAEGTR